MAYDENIDPKEKIFKSASFTELKGKAEGEVLRVYKAKNGDEIIGYIFDTETDGYSEKTEVLVGITTDGQIKGVELGINTRKNQYLASTFDTGLKKQFENIKAQEVELVLEARKKENDIQVVSGATISSKSIVNAVNAAVNLSNKMEGLDMKFTKLLKNGIVDENPVLVQVIGMCPTLGVTTSAINGLGMGLSTTAVLICSNIVISLMRKFIPDKIRIPAFIVVIATFVTMVGMLLKAYIPALDDALGLFIPLIVVNCLILARAESFASKNTPIKSAVDGIGMGLGFTLALTALGIVREILGNGTLFGMSLFGASYQPARLFILPPGAFLSLGFLLAGFNKLRNKKA